MKPTRILVLIMMATLPAAADPGTTGALGDSPSLDDYLSYAAKNNAGLQAAHNRWQATAERIEQVSALPEPRLSYGYFVEQVETRVGPQEQKIGVSQTLPWFGKRRLEGVAATEEAAAAQQVYEKTKLQLFRHVKAAYYEYWYLAQAVAVTRAHIKLVTNLEGVARTRFKAGTATHSSVIQAQVELGKLDDKLRTMEALRKPIVARLNAALNRSMHHPLPWPHSLPELDASFTDEQAQKWLSQSNPELLRLDHLAKREAAGIKRAKKNYYPDITLGVDYVQTDDALNPDMTDSGKDPIIAMVSMNLPIWHGKYRAAERESRLHKAAIEAQHDDAGKRLGADLELALYHFRDANRKIDLYKDTLIPKATQSLKVVQQGFEAGNTSFITWIDAQRLLLEFQLAQQRALADRGVRLAEVEALVSRDLSAVAQEKKEE
jgi:cobalt-zinc-cadmium efflux system outer membrane protein